MEAARLTGELKELKSRLALAKADQEADMLTITKLRAEEARLKEESKELTKQLDETRTSLFQLELREQDLTRSLKIQHANPRKDHPAIEALKVRVRVRVRVRDPSTHRFLF